MALCSSRPRGTISFFFFFNDTATTEIYTLSLHDALPILGVEDVRLVAGLEHRGERRRDLARVLEDAVDGDVRVLLLEQRDVLEPLLVLLRGAGGWRAFAAGRHVAARAPAGRRRRPSPRRPT